MKTTMSSKGRIVLPATLRALDGLEGGQEFDIERVKPGEYRLVRRRSKPNAGLVDWLLACPERDFFEALESDPTDTAGDFSSKA